MSISQKQSLRVFALPLTRPRANGARPPFVFYHVQSPPEPPSKNPHIFRRAMNKATTTWTAFGEADKTSWKYKLYVWGERVADRVEFEETALKAVNTSFKPQAESPEFDLGSLERKATFLHPSRFKDSLNAWKAHLRDREPYHKRYFYLWMIGLPVTAPIGLAPIIPNVPFYFCGWRAWSHWKAWRATTYLNQLCAQQYFESTSDPILDEIYDPTSVISDDAISPPPKLRSIEGDPEVEAQMLLRPADIPKITSSFNLAPSVGTELLRALDQSRMRLKKELKASQKGTK